jgi:hypothetical protein
MMRSPTFIVRSGRIRHSSWMKAPRKYWVPTRWPMNPLLKGLGLAFRSPVYLSCEGMFARKFAKLVKVFP